MTDEKKVASEEVRINKTDDRFPMLKALHAEAPATEWAEQMMLYGQFVGSWDGKVSSEAFHVSPKGEVIYDGSGNRQEATIEVHFGWVLQGRAIQDIWILPSHFKRDTELPDMVYGTTLRVYDPKADIWYITFIDPVSTQSYHRMVGRKVGNDIIQEYSTNEKLIQWNFTEITRDSFHWMWRESLDNGKTWKVPAEVFLNRRV